MGKRTLVVLIAFLLLFHTGGTGAEEAGLAFREGPGLIRPGRTELLRFESQQEGRATLSLVDSSGAPLFDIRRDFAMIAGENTLVWNGYDAAMKAVPEGDYHLRLQAMGEGIDWPVHVGPVSPQITQLMLQDGRVTPGQDWALSVQVNMPGTLAVVFHVADQQHELFYRQVPEGVTRVVWDGTLGGDAPPSGLHTLSVVFVDDTGFAANQQHITLEVAAQAESITDEGAEAFEGQDALPEGSETAADEGAEATPAQTGQPGQSLREGYHYAVPTRETVPEEDYGKDFWRLPVGDYNEEAIWKVMMQPITVLWGKAQRDVYRVRATPDDSTKRENIVGEVHYESQGVHVIEQREDGWSLVEVYNSSYGPNNRTRRGYGDTDALIRGYIRTSELRVIQPRDDYGIMIDKLRQRMYVFKEGKIFTELLISTGIPTRQQPWNETPSGEFLMVSRTGEFDAGNLVCRMSMRINGGALIHEVPYIVNQSTGYWDYSSQEAQLGKKASHGCIRVQRLNNSDGINMTWLWENIKVNTKVLVWDDDNRFYEYPDSALPLYYNPVGGKFYHLDQNCSSIKDRYLPLEGSLSYAELDNPEFAKLTPCAHCHPPLRASEIDAINTKNGF